MRIRRAKAEWKVLTHMPRASSPTRRSTRSFISLAALLVKVSAMMSRGCAVPVASR